MRLFRRIGTSIIAGVLALSALGLGGCFSPTKEGALSLPEAAIAPPAIAQEGVLRVGINSSKNAPFAGPSDGDIIGIDIDIAAALAEQMGLRLEIVEMQGQEPLALLNEGTIDVAMGIKEDISASFAGSKVGPYLIDGPAAFTVSLSGDVQDFDPAQLNGVKIAAQEASIPAWQVGKDYGDENLITYPSVNRVFDELSAGSVSYAASDAVVGSFLAIQYENIRCVGMLTEPHGIYLGVAPEKQELVSVLTDTLRRLRDGGSLSVIVTKWLGKASAQTVMSTQAIVALTPSGDGADVIIYDPSIVTEDAGDPEATGDPGTAEDPDAPTEPEAEVEAETGEEGQ